MSPLEPQPVVARPTVDLAEVGHAEVRAKLSDSFEGALPSPEESRVQAHLNSCPSCRAFAATLKRTIDMTRSLATIEPPPDLKSRILARASDTALPSRGG